MFRHDAKYTIICVQLYIRNDNDLQILPLLKLYIYFFFTILFNRKNDKNQYKLYKRV